MSSADKLRGVQPTPEGEKKSPNVLEAEQATLTRTRKKIAHTPAAPPELILRNEILTPPEITTTNIREVADFFRFIFNNDWPEFVVCPPCDSKLPNGMKLSAPEVYETDGQSVPVEIMDRLSKIPDCPNCQQPMQLFHDPQKTLQRLRERLSSDGYVSLLRDGEADQIEALTYGYGSTLKKQFESEWGNRYSYMAQQHSEYDRSFEKFLHCLNTTFPDANFEPHTEVFCWNCVTTSKKVRRSGKLPILINNFLDSIPPEKFKLWNIGEVIKDSRWHKILEKGGLKAVPGFLEPPETLTGVIFEQSANAFRLPPEKFSQSKTINTS